MLPLCSKKREEQISSGNATIALKRNFFTRRLRRRSRCSLRRPCLQQSSQRKMQKKKKFAPETQPKSFPFAKQRGAHKTLTANPNWRCISLRTYSSRCREGKIRIFIAYKYGYNAGIVSLMKPRKGRGSDQCWPVIFFFQKTSGWVGCFFKFFWDHTGYQYQYKNWVIRNFSVTTVGYA